MLHTDDMLSILAGPGETLADLHADHDPLSPLSCLTDGLAVVPADRVLYALRADVARDTRQNLILTALSLSAWDTL